MDFFPHRIAVTRVGNSISASKSPTALFINNFATTPINTASFALNITGSDGTAGSNYTVVGTRGVTGTTGATGFRGKHVYLLDVGWSTGSNTICYTITGIGISTYDPNPDPPGPGWFCDYGVSNTYYADAATLANGVTVYTTPSCSADAVLVNANVSDPVQVKAFSTNAFGIIISDNACIGGL